MAGRPRGLRRAHARARPRRRVRRLVLIAAGGAAALAIGLSPAGAKVGELRRGRGRDRRGGREAGAALAAGGGRAAGRVRAGSLDRPRGRLEAPARRLRRGDLVATRPLRRRHRRAASSSPSTPTATSAGPISAPAEVHDPRWSRERLPDRLPQRRRPVGGRRATGPATGSWPRTSRRWLRPGGRSRPMSPAPTASAATCSATRPRTSTCAPSTSTPAPEAGDPSRPRSRRDPDARAANRPGDLAGRHRTRGDPAGGPAHGARRDLRRRPAASAVLRPRAPDRADLVARRRLAAGRVAGGRPVAVRRADRSRRLVRFDHIPAQFDPGGTGDGRFPWVGDWVAPRPLTPVAIIGG